MGEQQAEYQNNALEELRDSASSKIEQLKSMLKDKETTYWRSKFFQDITKICEIDKEMPDSVYQCMKCVDLSKENPDDLLKVTRIIANKIEKEIKFYQKLLDRTNEQLQINRR